MLSARANIKLPAGTYVFRSYYAGDAAHIESVAPSCHGVQVTSTPSVPKSTTSAITAPQEEKVLCYGSLFVSTSQTPLERRNVDRAATHRREAHNGYTEATYYH